MIFDLRTQLFDHVQRFPLAFFTRTQTGTLTNRLNNDVIGAQRALTATLGTVVSNVIVLVTTVGAMLVHRLAAHHPGADHHSRSSWPPYRRIGQIQQNLTREGMNYNAEMNATMTERFNVSGALLVKLFGRQDSETEMFSERAAAGARHRRPKRHVHQELHDPVGPVWAPSGPPSSTGWAATSPSRNRSTRAIWWRSACSSVGCTSRSPA